MLPRFFSTVARNPKAREQVVTVIGTATQTFAQAAYQKYKNDHPAPPSTKTGSVNNLPIPTIRPRGR